MIENKITSSFQMNFIEFSITQSQTLSTTQEIADRIWVTLKPAGTILLLRHMKGPGEIPIYMDGRARGTFLINPWKGAKCLFWECGLKLFSPLRGTNSKTTHISSVIFLRTRYPKRYLNGCRRGSFKIEHSKRYQNHLFNPYIVRQALSAFHMEVFRSFFLLKTVPELAAFRRFMKCLFVGCYQNAKVQRFFSCEKYWGNG